MARSSLLLASLASAILLAVPQAGHSQSGTSPTAEASEAEDRLEAARLALEKAQASLQQAEDTGGDIRAARRSVANALKSLRGVEAASGVDPAPLKPAPIVPAPAPVVAAPQPPPVAAPKTEPPPAPAAPAVVEAPKPYVPPTAASRPKGSGEAVAVPPKKPEAAAKDAAPNVAKPAKPRPAAPVVVRRDGLTETTRTNPDGTRTRDFTDRGGRLVRRIEIDRRGNEIVVIDQERVNAGRSYDEPVYADPMEVPPPPGQAGRYVLDGGRASSADIEATLEAAPVERLGRGYSVNEIRRDARIRNMVRRVDIDTITFETGSARVPDDQVRKLQAIGRALGRMIDRRPDQVFLIEGHTDAVGTRFANLELSDRRAASIAGILTQYFGIPPQNLVAQGYGEDNLKIPAQGPERQNRRVTIRNITPLLDVRG